MSDVNNHQTSSEQDILDDVLRRAAVDRDFRERLLNEPGAVLARVTGQELPEDYTVRFIEKDEDTDALIVLPDMVPETMELSEAELEAVAGGGDDSKCWWVTDVSISISIEKA